MGGAIDTPPLALTAVLLAANKRGTNGVTMTQMGSRMQGRGERRTISNPTKMTTTTKNEIRKKQKEIEGGRRQGRAIRKKDGGRPGE